VVNSSTRLPDRLALLFSFNSFVAAMLALYIALAIGLSQPSWAMMTAFIVSHPLSGAVRSKALYRLAGTALGAIAAVVMVPLLANAPVLLSGALALWVGGCLSISLLDRTPRSYLLMLAGYTAAIIAFPSVANPGAIFDAAVSRVTEIGLGILCATTIHSLIFPQPVGDALQKRLAAWLEEADRWALDILRHREAAVIVRDRQHLAAAASEIHLLATHLPFDTSRLDETAAAVQALHNRMVLLIPLLSGIADRMATLAAVEDREVRELIDAVAAWIDHRPPGTDPVALRERLVAAAARAHPDGWHDLLTHSLLVRLADLVVALAESRSLVAHIRDPRVALGDELERELDQAVRHPMHSDWRLALRSGIAASVAILLSCAVWIGTGWADGATAAVMTAVFCCFFAALDDPVPAIIAFGVATLAALPLAAVYAFAILPRINEFPLLVAVLAPLLLGVGLFVPDPRYANPATALTVGFYNALGLQGAYAPDFATFLNVNLAQAAGLISAIVVTGSLRSMGLESSVQRLRRQTWRDLSRLARARSAPPQAAFAAALVDRIGLLTPKLSAISGSSGSADAEAALRDLRAGMNVVGLLELRDTLPPADRRPLDGLLLKLAEHFTSRAAAAATDSKVLLDQLDRTLAALLDRPGERMNPSIQGLVGLRRNLFPTAPDYRAPAGVAA